MIKVLDSIEKNYNERASRMIYSQTNFKNESKIRFVIGEFIIIVDQIE